MNISEFYLYYKCYRIYYNSRREFNIQFELTQFLIRKFFSCNELFLVQAKRIRLPFKLQNDLDTYGDVHKISS